MTTSILHRARRPRLLATTGTLLAALALAGCSGDDETGGDPDDPNAGLSEVAAHAGEECPTELPQSESGEVTDPATETPSLAAPESAFVCLYDSMGETAAWRLSGAPVAVGDRDLDAVATLLSELEPPKEGQQCTTELGPRWLLVSTVGEDLTGVTVDDYGCADVRISDDPFTNPPGEATQDGTVEGVLGGSEDLLNRLKLIWVDG